VNSEVSVQFTRTVDSVTLSVPPLTGIEVLNLEDDIKTFQMSHLTGVEKVYMARPAWDFFAEAGVSLAFELSHGTISLCPLAVSSLGSQSKGSTVAVSLSLVNVENAGSLGDVVYRFDIYSDAQAIVDFEGTIVIQLRSDGAIPAGIWIMREHGEMVRAEYIFDPETYLIVLDMNSAGVYIIRRNIVPTPNQNQQNQSELMLVGAIEPLASEQDFDNFEKLRFVIGNRTFSFNGTTYTNDVAPFLDPANDRTMLPLRTIAEIMGAQVQWNPETRAVSIFSEKGNFSFVVDEPLPNGMGVPVIRNDRTLVPLRYIAESLGAVVRWDGENEAAYVYF